MNLKNFEDSLSDVVDDIRSAIGIPNVYADNELEFGVVEISRNADNETFNVSFPAYTGREPVTVYGDDLVLDGDNAVSGTNYVATKVLYHGENGDHVFDVSDKEKIPDGIDENTFNAADRGDTEKIEKQEERSRIIASMHKEPLSIKAETR